VGNIWKFTRSIGDETQMRLYRWIYALGLAAGVAVLLVMFSNGQKGPDPETGRSNQIARDTVEMASTSDRPGSLGENLNPPKLDLDESSKPMVIVDSLPPTAQGALGDWDSLEGSAGHFDQLVLVDGSRPGDAGVSAIDILVARGWAGDTGLGMRLVDVLLARCDRIVGRAKVTLDRPDVAKAVHPNLVRSGWEAQLLAGHLPSCGDDNFSAWAVVPGSPALLIPLIGRHAVTVDRVGAPSVSSVSAQTEIRPEAYSAQAEETFEILASRANLRRCGSITCAVTGQIDRGTHSGILLDSNGEWSLMGFGDSQGWLFNGLFRRTQ
jgi:hypothetical protein